MSGSDGAQHLTPLWEVFIRPRNGLNHKHVGSLHAADAEMALSAARDVYTRREEGNSIWVVPSNQIVASDPDLAAENFDPAADKAYRHPSFYDIPDDVGHM
ncbi:MAG: 1,2-phenylacetyl-CoA epoxidase subunit PaaB [Pseudomonadota bacterium]